MRDYGRLTGTHQNRFNAALAQFIADLQSMEAGEQYWFRPGLRVKRVRGVPGLYEMTWAPDGRATFSCEVAQAVIRSNTEAMIRGLWRCMGLAPPGVSRHTDGASANVKRQTRF